MAGLHRQHRRPTHLHPPNLGGPAATTPPQQIPPTTVTGPAVWLGATHAVLAVHRAQPAAVCAAVGYLFPACTALSPAQSVPLSATCLFQPPQPACFRRRSPVAVWLPAPGPPPARFRPPRPPFSVRAVADRAPLSCRVPALQVHCRLRRRPPGRRPRRRGTGRLCSTAGQVETAVAHAVAVPNAGGGRYAAGESPPGGTRNGTARWYSEVVREIDHVGP